MAQYQVPQFIEVEDKIFGPLTIRQFIYLAGGAGACLLLFTLLPLWLAVPLMIPPLGLACALAFYRVNGPPLIYSLEHAFAYFTGSKLYLWKQRETKASSPELLASSSSKLASNALQVVPKLSQSKLKDLAWSLNIKDRSQGGGAPSEPGKFAI